MRLGGQIFKNYSDPHTWAAAVKEMGYRAAYCPVKPGTETEIIDAYAAAAREADIIIAEAGAWSNPLDADPEKREKAMEFCKQSLELADRIDASCCVNIAGSRGSKWDGPAAADLLDETFDMIVEITQEIIDAVNPRRTFFTLETMPWMLPDSVDSYLQLIRAINRKSFGVHLDPVNLITGPRLYYHNTALLKECFARLGAYIKSCHTKDIILRDNYTVHLDEVLPGQGTLDYPTYLRELAGLEKDVPLMIEHLPDEASYRQAARYITSVAEKEKLKF